MICFYFFSKQRGCNNTENNVIQSDFYHSLMNTTPEALSLSQAEYERYVEIDGRRFSHLLNPITDALGPRATLHIVEAADHGFTVLKRSGRTPADIQTELAQTSAAFLAHCVRH